jgi:hypothetical protein
MEQRVRIERSRDRKRTLMALGRPIPMLTLTDEERDDSIRHRQAILRNKATVTVICSPIG